MKCPNCGKIVKHNDVRMNCKNHFVFKNVDYECENCHSEWTIKKRYIFAEQEMIDYQKGN